MPLATLDLTGMRIEEVSWAGSRLRTEYGDGYGDMAVVGAVGGLHRWVLHSGGIWPDVTTHGLTIGGLARFAYYWEFFKTHTTGGTDIFILPFRSKNYHASFVDASMSAERLRKTLDLYEAGVKIRQRRIVGQSYNADGSIP